MANEPYVVFSQRAFNSIVTETIHKNPVETGGILIGYVLDNGVRIPWLLSRKLWQTHTSLN